MTASRRRLQGFTLRQAQGFTLIELTLVVLLVLVIAGLSTPLFKKTLSDLSARNTSFSICKLINYAQEMAVLERVNYRIAFDFKKGGYQLLEVAAPVKNKPVYKKVTGRFGKLFALPQGLSLSGTKPCVIFYPDGHCDDVNVNVMTKLGGYSVTVKGFGNNVQVKEFKIER